MDQIKLLVKDVLYKIQDIPDMAFPSIRMSEIASHSSTTSEDAKNDISHNLYLEPLRDHIDSSIVTGEDEEIIPNVPVSKVDTISEDTNTRLKNLTITTEVNNETSLARGHNQNNPNSNHADFQIKKETSISSNLDGKGSHDSVFSVSSEAVSLGRASDHPRIIMGKRALLRSRSGEMQNDSATVHELVNVYEKYQDKVLHYADRMYQRRLSRESRSADDASTDSNYSVNSLKTPESFCEEKRYFSLLYSSKRDDISINSIDDLNPEDSFEFCNSTSMDNKDVSTDFEFDAKKFLQNAFGENSLDSQSTGVDSVKQVAPSMDLINKPSLLTRAGSFCNSVRKSLRKACSVRDIHRDNFKNKNRNRERCQSFSPDYYGSAENLMRELYVQNGIIFQVSKALTFCRNSKDVTSPEYIEAEKILLVASCQKEAIQTLLDATEYLDFHTCYQTSFGTLDISEVIFYLKGDLCTEAEEPQTFDEYFVIVVTSGKTVLSSKVLVPDKNGEIRADKQFQLTGLQTGFTASVAVYSLRIPRVSKHHRLNNKHQKKDRKTPCPSTKSFFHINSHKSSRKCLLVDNVSSIQSSSFTLWGSCSICCSDLENTHFRMHNTPLSSSLEGYFTAILTGHVTLTNRTSGFLTIGFEDKSHLIWNRRWCLLDGALLKYWNYPSEEFSSNPIGVLDLTYASGTTSPADRSVCPRPKTLCLSLKSKDDSVLTYFLSADSSTEKDRWQEDINKVIDTLMSWNSLRPKERVSSF